MEKYRQRCVEDFGLDRHFFDPLRAETPGHCFPHHYSAFCLDSIHVVEGTHKVSNILHGSFQSNVSSRPWRKSLRHIQGNAPYICCQGPPVQVVAIVHVSSKTMASQSYELGRNYISSIRYDEPDLRIQVVFDYSAQINGNAILGSTSSTSCGESL